MSYMPVQTDKYTIAAWGRLSDSFSPVHIYIEGDGHAFNARGRPTLDPTPSGNFLRKLVMQDNGPNVVYLARPCQYVMSPSCSVSDWTTGRFADTIIESMAHAVKTVACARPIVLVGYSGGAMLSGLIIDKNPNLNVVKWVTIAGVLNHADWTQYFNDTPLSDSRNMNELPRVSQLHYAAGNDNIVPNRLSYKWTGGKNLVVIPNAEHDDFPDWTPDLSIDKY